MLLDPHLGQRQAKATKYPLPRAVVFLQPQRPDGDPVLPTPTTAASAQCLPLQLRLFLVGLDILRGQDIGPPGLQPSLQGPS